MSGKLLWTGVVVDAIGLVVSMKELFIVGAIIMAIGLLALWFDK